MLRAKFALLITVLVVFLTALPVFAQEAATTATTADAGGPTGITTLVILAGFGAMLVVGAMMYAKSNAKDGHEVD